MGEASRAAWNEFMAGWPEAHLLQTAAWGELKAAFGWRLRRFIAADGSCGAQVLIRPLPPGFSLAYIPKGPVGNLPPAFSLSPGQALTPGPSLEVRGEDALAPGSGGMTGSLLREIDAALRRERAVLLKVEPDVWERRPPAFREAGGEAPPASEPVPPGFRLSPHEIQPARTLVVDISGSEADVLGRMKQKTRYNIRLAQKKGVCVAPSSDLDGFNRLMALTGERDRFGVHSPQYYRRAYDLFQPQGQCELLIAELEGEPLAALMVFARGSRAWYFYGASSDERREAMPAYLLQWEAMRWARLRGCREYDLWGVPDAGLPELEAGFTARADGLWGVYRFKRGFGGELRRAPGPWDRVYIPLLYRLYLRRAAR